jgi:hypothetical protein
VRRCLSPVHNHDRSLLVRPSREPLDRVDRPERVRDEVIRDNFDIAVASDRVELRQVELPALVEVDHSERRTGPLRHVLPGNEVRVVLELSDDDDVAGLQVDEAPGIRDEVEPLRRTSNEDHFAW